MKILAFLAVVFLAIIAYHVTDDAMRRAGEEEEKKAVQVRKEELARQKTAAENARFERTQYLFNPDGSLKLPSDPVATSAAPSAQAQAARTQAEILRKYGTRPN